jgi:hypothetical protein
MHGGIVAHHRSATERRATEFMQMSRGGVGIFSSWDAATPVSLTGWRCPLRGQWFVGDCAAGRVPTRSRRNAFSLAQANLNIPWFALQTASLVWEAKHAVCRTTLLNEKGQL